MGWTSVASSLNIMFPLCHSCSQKIALVIQHETNDSVANINNSFGLFPALGFLALRQYQIN